MRKEKLILMRLALLFLTVFSLLFGACGKQERYEQEKTAGETTRLAVESVQETDFFGPYQVLFDGESLWGIGADRSEDIYRFSVEKGFSQRVPWREAEEKAETVCLSLDWEGNLSLFVKVNGGISHRVMTGQGNWEVKTNLDCGEELAEQAQFLCENAEGYLCLATEGAVHLYDPEGSEVTVYDLPGRVVSLQAREDGGVECVTLSDFTMGFYRLEDTSGKAELLWEETFLGGVQFLSSDDVIWVLLREGQGSLCSIDKADGAILTEQSMEDVAISFNSVIGGWFDGETDGYLYEQGDDGRMEIHRLVEREAGEETRTELVYGTTFLLNGTKERIVNFNKTSSDYYITVRIYNDSSRLNADLVSGNGPDIIDMSNNFQNYAVYAKKGILEDITSYLESQGDDFLLPVYSPYKINDSIYMLIPHFTVSMLILDARDASDMDEWNMDTFFRLAEEHAGEKDVFGSGGKEDVLSKSLVGMWDQFVDMENGKADFDNENFIALLEFADRCGDVNPEDHIGMTDDFIGEYLFYDAQTDDPTDYLAALQLHEETIVLGYPLMDGETFPIDICRDAMAINAASPNKEGAWEFLQTFLEEDYQKDVIKDGFSYIWGWPVYKSMIEESLVESRKETTLWNGKLLSEVTDEEIAQFLEIVQDADHLSTHHGIIPVEIETIVSEETQAYFNGGMSAEKAAENIQNRVQLVLDEQ